MVKSTASNQYVRRGLVFGVLASVALGLTAAAQPGRGGGLSPEARAKVNATQAKVVAADLKLDEGKMEAFVAAYEAFQKESANNRPSFGRGDRDAMQKYADEQQSKLEDSLKSVVDENQAKAAADILAGSSRGWDQMVSVLLGFELDAEKQSLALAHTLAYVKAGSKARQDASGDFSAVRDAMVAAKKTLDESLAPLLSEEQVAQWNEATSWGGGRRGGDRGDRGNRGREAN